MKVSIKKVDKTKTTDFSQIMTTATLSGDTGSVARKLEFTVVTSETDTAIPKVKLTAGNKVSLSSGRTKLFEGFIFTFSQSHSSDNISYTAYDPLIYLMKNEGAYNFKKTTAEAVAKKVLADFKLPVGKLAKTKIAYKRIHIGVSLYSIIMHSYAQAAKQNGKKYIMTFTGGKINVIEKGEVVRNFTLQNKVNLTESNYSFSIESMVNAVVIVDKKGKRIGEIKNKKWIKTYGRLQKIYQQEKKSKKNNSKLQSNTAKKAAAEMQGPEKQASVTSLGDIRCVCGRGVNLKDTYTGLTGRFWISADSHTFEQDAVLGEYSHTMDLTLEYKNIMDSGG